MLTVLLFNSRGNKVYVCMYVCMYAYVSYVSENRPIFIRLVELTELAINSTAFKIDILPRPGAGCMNAVRPD